MTERSKALGALALFFAASFALAWLVSPWAEVIAIALVIGIAPPATLFAAGYMLTRPWWETRIGKAMLIGSTGLALLVDISLLYKVFGENYALRDAVRLTVYWVVFVGAWYKFGAFVVPDKWVPKRFRDQSRKP